MDPEISWFIASSAVALLGVVGGIAVTAASSSPKSFKTVTLIDAPIEYSYTSPPDDVSDMSHYFDERASAIIRTYKKWNNPSTILPAIQQFKGSVGSGLDQAGAKKYTQEQILALKGMMSFYGRVEAYLKQAIEDGSAPTCDQFERTVVDIMTDVKRQ